LAPGIQEDGLGDCRRFCSIFPSAASTRSSENASAVNDLHAPDEIRALAAAAVVGSARAERARNNEPR
jgi:hypothetical protein